MTSQVIIQFLVIPFFVGVVIPFLTNWITARGWPEYVETVLNFALSALTAVIVAVPFNGTWQEYLLALGVAWVGALRGHYLGLAQALYSNQVKGKHETPEL